MTRWEQPLRAGISAFGASGSNAHVVVESAEGVEAAEEHASTPWALVLSARTRPELQRYAGLLAKHLERKEGWSAAGLQEEIWLLRCRWGVLSSVSGFAR